MEVLTAGLVLAWLVIIVLAFAMAGLLRQLRDVQAILNRPGGVAVAKASLPDAVRPSDGRRYALVLLASKDCPICDEVLPAFAELAGSGPDVIDFLVVTATDDAKWHALPRVRHLPDAGAYHLLDPGWRPAIVLLDERGTLLASEPASSPATMESLIDGVREQEAAR